MFLRLVVVEWHESSLQLKGLFGMAYEILQRKHLDVKEREALQEILTWFENNLPIPRTTSITRQCVFWYKGNASECIRRMWQLARLLQEQGFVIEEQKCDWPGSVVYEDEFQVAAWPRNKRR